MIICSGIKADSTSYLLLINQVVSGSAQWPHSPKGSTRDFGLSISGVCEDGRRRGRKWKTLPGEGGCLGLTDPITLVLFKWTLSKRGGKWSLLCYSPFVEASIIMVQNLSRWTHRHTQQLPDELLPPHTHTVQINSPPWQQNELSYALSIIKWNQ